MDDIVLQALAKWPNVPHCHGWLALDARGDWYMRDDRIQALGPFPHPKGSRIQHDKLLSFIHRNYGRDDTGAWFFQNGPQRVYVELEATPFVLRLTPSANDAGADRAPSVHTHAGGPFDATQALVDEQGRVYLADDRSVGLVHSMDMPVLADCVDADAKVLQVRGAAGQQVRLPIEPCKADELPARFGYVRSPGAPREGPAD